MVRPYYALLHYALHSLLEGRWQDQRNSAHQNSMSVADTKYSIYRPPATWSPLRKYTWSPGHPVTWSPGHLVTTAYKSRWRQSREIDCEVTRAKPSSGHLYDLRSCLVSHGIIVRVLPQYPVSSADVFLIFFSVIFSFFQNIKTFFC